MLYLFLGGLASGLLASVIASTKQRSPLVWFAIGALLPLIGVTAAAVVVAARGPDEPPDAAAPILPTQWVLTFEEEPDLVTCGLCRNRVSRLRCRGTAEGVLCDTCEAMHS